MRPIVAPRARRSPRLATHGGDSAARPVGADLAPAGRRYRSRIGYRLLGSTELDWRATNVLGAENADLGAKLGTLGFGARLWRFRPGQASLAHRHREEQELYVLLEGEGRITVDGDVLTLQPLAALVVDVDSVRQIFNDTPADQVWLIVGAPREQYRLADLSDDERDVLYPYGLASLPPELRGQTP